MSQTEELRHREQSSRGGCLIVGVIALIVFYVLSPPLVIMALNAMPAVAPDPAFEIVFIIYVPLEYLAENVEWVNDFYDWYLGLFGYR